MHSSPDRGDAAGGAPQAAPGARLEWVDVARGIGIMLVVYGHSLRGHFAPINRYPAVFAQDRVIYAFHMPLFFVLAGLFLWPSIAKGRDRYIRSRWEQVIYPYLLWSALTAICELTMSAYVNSPISIETALLIPFVPIEQYWFLYTLLVTQLIAAAVYPRLWMYCAIAVFGQALLLVTGGGWIVLRALLYLPYVAAGALLAKPLMRLADRPRAVVALFVGSWLIFVAALGWDFAQPQLIWHQAIASLAGSLGTIATAMLVARLPVSAILNQLGAASLAIFVAHTIVSAGTRISLSILGFSPASLPSVGLATILGLAIPWCAWRLATDRGYAPLLGFGAQPASGRNPSLGTVRPAI